MQIDQILLSLGLPSSFAEWVTIAAVLLGLSTAFWLLIGRFRLHNFLINTYISFALVQVVPKDIMSFTKYSYALLFLILLVFLMLVNKYLFEIHQYGSGLAIWQVLIVSFLEVMLLLSIVFSFLEQKEILKYISKQSLGYFISPWWQIAWMVLPILFLVMIKRRSN